jgi:hypothetical protein
MDQALRDFQLGGVADAVAAWDDRVTVTTSADTATPVTTVELAGVQSDVEVNPEELEQFGFPVKRVFSLFVAGTVDTAAIKSGNRATEAKTGETARVLYHKRDHLGTTFFFGSVNK